MNCHKEDNIGVPHLIECTVSDDPQPVYTLNVGITQDDLTEDEKRILEQSENYIRTKVIKKLGNCVVDAKQDFELLRDIPGMPEAAIEILRKWTNRPGDDWEEDEE